ncbi:MAG TPA: hypothetical protein VKH35_11750 [Thermoanaerobaculia bacterium]|nr:hypothetical protein [Thermoanaerobaculia bacterium]
METLLNLLWLSIAVAALFTAPRRSLRVLLALGCVLAVLFPIVSISDDLNGSQAAYEETVAIVVTAVILLIALVAVAVVERTRPRRRVFVPLLVTDIRPPPAR